jgi:hypothetical protein
MKIPPGSVTINILTDQKTLSIAKKNKGMKRKPSMASSYPLNKYIIAASNKYTCLEWIFALSPASIGLKGR